jgi:hypothetical protein
LAAIDYIHVPALPVKNVGGGRVFDTLNRIRSIYMPTKANTLPDPIVVNTLSVEVWPVSIGLIAVRRLISIHSGILDLSSVSII